MCTVDGNRYVRAMAGHMIGRPGVMGQRPNLGGGGDDDLEHLSATVGGSWVACGRPGAGALAAVLD